MLKCKNIKKIFNLWKYYKNLKINQRKTKYKGKKKIKKLEWS